MTRERLVNVGMSLVVVGLVTVIRGPIEQWSGVGASPLYYLPIVTLAAWNGGFGAGVVAVVIWGLAWIYFLVPPTGGFQIGSQRDQYRFLVFLFEGMLLSALVEVVHTVQRSSDENARAAERYRMASGRNEAQLRAILENSSAPIWLKDAEGRYLLVNRQFETLVRRSGREIVGKADSDLFHPPVADPLHANDRAVLDLGQAVEAEEVLHTDDGPRTFLSVKFPLRDGRGSAYAIGGILTDITERKHAERLVRESEERFRTLSACSPVGVFLTDTEGRTTYTNARCREIFDFTEAESLADAWIERVHPDDRSRVIDTWRRSAASALEFSQEYRTRDTRGRVRWVHDRTAPLLSDLGALIGHVGTVEDITELKEAQARAVQVERLAAIGQMVTGLAHESRNALQRSQACLEMLAFRLEDQPEALDLVAGVQDAQDDLQRLYEEVRTYAAPIHLDRRSECLRGLARDAWANLEVVWRGRDAHLIESGDPEVHAEVDPHRMVQVFRNVLDNALAACHDPVRIVVHWSHVDLDGRAAVRASVRDNGPGLTVEARRNLFEPFYTTKTHGTGLGLAITRRIVDAHGGSIAVGSDGPPGAEIVLTLPQGPS